MASLFSRLNRKPSEPAPPASPAAPPAGPTAAPLTLVSLELARDLLRNIEHFVFSSPDLDVLAFLERLRRTAANLTPEVPPGELENYSGWVSNSVTAFGQAQRRYLAEREDELWKLLTLYQENQRLEGASDTQFNDALRGIHERMGNLARLEDLRQLRERMELEMQNANIVVAKKLREDGERSTTLVAKVQQLEAALLSARHDAVRDPLTGVYHRGGFEAQLLAALASPAPCALAVVDVDNFKGINDTLGHLVGDQVLKLTVQILGKLSRPGDVLGRYGGDEFCLLTPALQAERLRDRFQSVAPPRTLSFDLEDRNCALRYSMSVGVAGSQPGDTPETLFARADEALYAAKRAGKGRAHVHEQE